MGLKNFKINILVLLLIIFYTTLVDARLSNESLTAKDSLIQSEKDIFDMVNRNISIKRVNETYQEAWQFYTAQFALDEKGGRANYDLVMKYTLDISNIKKFAIEANDELKIFNENYGDVKKETNLSDMDQEYNQIILSFKEERFEDTLVLIKKGYDKISEIQSSQTAVNAVYSATAKTLKNFFIKNWLRIIIIIFILLVVFIIFHSALNKLMTRIRLNNLIVQKRAIKGLIKDIQESYFKKRSMSEAEYTIKLKKYEELTRDIDRQIMILKEEIFKLSKAKG